MIILRMILDWRLHWNDISNQNLLSIVQSNGILLGSNIGFTFIMKCVPIVNFLAFQRNKHIDMSRQTNKITLYVKFDESAEVFRLNVWKGKERKKKRTKKNLCTTYAWLFFFFSFVEHWFPIRLWCLHYFLVASNSMQIVINHESKVIQFWFLSFFIRENFVFSFIERTLDTRMKWIFINVLLLYIELCANECFSDGWMYIWWWYATPSKNWINLMLEFVQICYWSK